MPAGLRRIYGSLFHCVLTVNSIATEFKTEAKFSNMVLSLKPDWIKMNGYTYKGNNSFIFIIASHLVRGLLLMKEFAPLGANSLI